MYDDPINTTLNTKSNKKRIKLIATIIIVIFALLIVTFILLFTLTDIFKTDKELFFKTVSQISNKEDSFIDNKITQYFEKKKTTPYENQGSYTVSISQGNEQAQQMLDKINNINIEFSGKTDNLNSKAQQEIKLNYSDEVNIPLNYKKIGSIIGIQADYLSTNYFAFDTSKLIDFLGINIDLDKASQVEFTEEEKEHISEIFTTVLDEQLPKDKFTKTKGMEETGYKLTLTLGEVKNIYSQLLERIKNDQIILNKINEISSNNQGAQITADDIQKIIDSFSDNIEEEINDTKIEMIAYSKNKKLSKISINVSKDSMQGNIEISKNQDSNSNQYIFSMNFNNENNNFQMKFSIGYVGLQQMQNVEESYELDYNKTQDGNTQLEGIYTISDNVNFSEDAANIEDFDKPNTILLSNHEKEQVYDFLGKVGERFVQVNEQAVNQAGLADLGNPLMFLVPFGGPIALYNSTQTITDSTQMSEVEMTTFNNKFIQYEGSGKNGAIVKSLIQTVLASNSNAENEERQIEIDGVVKFNGTDFDEGYSMSNINNSSEYEVKCEYNEEGFINKIIINEE